MPPAILAQRMRAEVQASWDRIAEPRYARRLDSDTLLRRLDAESVDELWARLAARPHAAETARRASAPAQESVRARAAAAVRREVDLLGSGPTTLGAPIDWHKDFKSGYRWSVRPAWRIAYADLGKPNDVKVPWELSRLQWLIPVGQDYLLGGNDDRAAFARRVIEEWVEANPYLQGVNWASTMEVAMRLVTLTWLFHVFAGSMCWEDPRFRMSLLRAMFLHGRFIERNLERSDVNGNHLVADLAGLVFAGEFFGQERWAETGWAQLEAELPRQVTPDGVDHEMSTAYHRLVAELFLLPALYRLRVGKPVGEAYRLRLHAMANFTNAYSTPAGAPLWGDADDARALPFGSQAIDDHAYLPGLIRSVLGAAAETSEESFWLLGPTTPGETAPPVSEAFPDGGVYVLRGRVDQVFVDCGPVGLRGRGGHGHNDCLSFDAVLDGVRVVTDCGSYVYTASVEWRNLFRSTAFHNTPRIDEEELNRFVSQESLWHLRYDARPKVIEWTPGVISVFRGAHSGYERLASPVTVHRRIVLDTQQHRLEVADSFTGRGRHAVAVPFHLDPQVTVEGDALVAAGRRFRFRYEGDWKLGIRDAWVSPSYGRKVMTRCLELTRTGPLASLLVVVEPSDGA